MKNVSVVLSEVRNPLNIGAAARALANFGFSDLRLANAYRLAADEARSAPNAGAILEAAREYPTLADALADATLVVGTTSATKRDIHLPIKPLPDAAAAILASPRPALVFGSEKFGLSNTDMSHCHWLVRIPTVAEVPSMNLGQAVALTLYELVRSPSPEVDASLPHPAPAGMLNELTDRLHEVLALSGYVHSPATEDKLRRLVLRLNLRHDDAVMWLGMVRQILWRLTNSR